MHGRLVEEQGLPQNLHARCRLPDVLSHAAHLYRYLLRAHCCARVEAQREGHARHACSDQHPSREDQDCAHARGRLCDVCAVMAAALLYRTAHVVRTAASTGGEDTVTDVPSAVGAMARRLQQLRQSVYLLLLQRQFSAQYRRRGSQPLLLREDRHMTPARARARASSVRARAGVRAPVHALLSPSVRARVAGVSRVSIQDRIRNCRATTSFCLQRLTTYISVAASLCRPAKYPDYN